MRGLFGQRPAAWVAASQPWQRCPLQRSIETVRGLFGQRSAAWVAAAALATVSEAAAERLVWAALSGLRSVYIDLSIYPSIRLSVYLSYPSISLYIPLYPSISLYIPLYPSISLYTPLYPSIPLSIDRSIDRSI